MKIKFEIYGDMSSGGFSQMIHLRAVKPQPAESPLFGTGGEFVLHLKLIAAEKLAAKLAAGETVVEIDFPQFD